MLKLKHTKTLLGRIRFSDKSVNFSLRKDLREDDRTAASEVTKTLYADKHHRSYNNASECGSKLDSLVYTDSSVAI